jgi:ethanolamine utilization protein EutN
MYFGRVVGCVWCTAKSPGLTGLRLLVVQPLTPQLENTGKRIVCTDSAGAGAGELVYWVRGKEASFPFLPAEAPTDTSIVGIVDSVHLQAPEVMPHEVVRQEIPSGPRNSRKPPPC